MNRRHALAIALALTSTAALAPVAAAAPVGLPVSATVYTTFDGKPAQFTSSIEGCEAGFVTEKDMSVKNRETPWGGVFIGIKEFKCEGKDADGFALRLKARYGEFGATGTWTLAYAWGDFTGAKASGTLVGIPGTDMITDIYTGIAR
jgi:hypothetical protein